jgi:hypothetical protein
LREVIQLIGITFNEAEVTSSNYFHPLVQTYQKIKIKIPPRNCRDLNTTSPGAGGTVDIIYIKEKTNTTL